MAELGIAAGVGGLVSLGITLCQGFMNYYGAYKGQDEVVRRFLVAVDGLQSTCKSLGPILESLGGQRLPQDTYDAVKNRMGEFEEVLRNLENELKSIKTVPPPDANLWGKTKAKMRSTIYPFKEGTLLKLQGLVADSRDNLLFALTALNMQVQTRKIEEVGNQVVNVDKLVRAMKDNIEDFRKVSASDQEAKRQQKVFAWLSPSDPYKLHQNSRKQRVPNTGEWLLDSQQYKHWKSRPSTLCLWGLPGCGKTILCSTIIEDVGKYCEEKNNQISESHPVDQHGSALGYFYFDFRAERKQLDDLVRSLLVQFALQTRSAGDCLGPLYSRSRNGLREPQLEELEEALHEILDTFDTAYIVIDALDECQNRKSLRTALQKMVQWKSKTSLHFLFMTREDQDLKKVLEDVRLGETYKPLTHDKIDGDIEEFVQSMLRSEERLSAWPDSKKEDIKKTLTEGSNGVFRWAKCQIDVLSECVRMPLLDAALKSLPKDLNETYERDLCAIKAVNEKDAFKTLQWLTFGARPLQLRELGDILAVDGGQYDMKNRPQKPRDIFLICPSLITLEPQTGDGWQASIGLKSDDDGGNVRLAHFSVKDYLTSDDIKSSKAGRFSMSEAEAHPLMAEISLVYLLQFLQLDITSPNIDENSSLARYSARYWYYHTFLIKEDAKADMLWPLIDQLLDPDKTFFTKWRQLCDPDRNQPRIYRRRRNDGKGSPLYYASLLGLSRVVWKIMEVENVDIDAQGGSYGNALQAACAQGYYEVAELLLEKGANVDAVTGYFGTAIQAASYHGDMKVVDLLLGRGCKVNIEAGEYGTALQAACLQGHENIAKRLVGSGASIDSTCGEYWTALQAAASQARISICKWLVDQGAILDHHGGHYDTALEAAAYTGSKPLVELFHSKGADVNGRPGDRGNPLQAAAFRGHADVVEYLLKEGATIDSGHGIYGNALLAASYRNNLSVVNLILNQGKRASIEAKTQAGETALHWAAMFGNSELVQCLLENNLDPKERDVHEWNPVLLAWMYQRDSSSHELLMRAANTSAHGGSFGLAPTHLVKALDCPGSSGMVIEQEGMGGYLEEPNYEDVVTGAQVPGNHPFVAGSGRQYFTVEVIKTGPQCIIGIGICDQICSRRAMPGWNHRSWAYHGDDGMKYGETGAGKPYGPTYGKGDVIGCGIDVATDGRGTIFFTKNGVHLGDAFQDLKGRLFPVIGTRERGTKFRVEFGVGYDGN